jgi:orotate phosphoribosyltransferase
MNEKERLAKMLEDCGAVRFGNFTLTSGAKSTYYIDIKKASTDPKVLKYIAKQMAKFTEKYDVLAGMELGAVPLVVALSLETNFPYVIIRKEMKEHGTNKQIEGSEVNNKKVLLVEDVTTSGRSVVNAVNILRDNKAVVNEVITVVDRESGAKDVLNGLHVKLISLLRASEFVKNQG